MLSNDPLWFKNAIIYEVPVRAYADSNGDGIGDFRGLTEKLDYIQDLGVTALWLLPFFPSPLRDDGYDIADYTSVNPIYGTLEDFKAFLDAAHQREIRVIIELIVNHTSDQHPWFQRARRSPKGSPEREFYVWSDTLEKYREARIIFQDFETSNWSWDAIAKAYYWHRFYSHQPDLNYDNPAVQQAVTEVMDFWLQLGVDGLRLDAVPYLYEREGTNCENLPETHTFLKQLRSHIDQHYPNRMLLAEANQWPEDAAQYYGCGDECHMNFHFPLMPRLFMSLRMEDSFPITDILQQTPSIPDNCQWALFLRNHDELTLEMVSDEDRDYMYRVYAQDPEMRVNLGIRRRLAPLLGNDRRQVELLNSLLLSLPGTPVLYYGDEIGMGDNVYVGDRNGVRTPMQWSADRNAGFSRASSQRLYLPTITESEYHYAAINVEAQRANPNSLWYTMKRLIATRKRFEGLGKGGFEFLHPENRKVLAFLRTFQDEPILVVANLSRFVQTVELDLSAFKGARPVEIFGRTEFPVIEDSCYFLSLSPYGFYWFLLKPQPIDPSAGLPSVDLPLLELRQPWEQIFAQPHALETRQFISQLEAALPTYLQTCRWFSGKARTIQSIHLRETVPIPQQDQTAYLILLDVDYIQGNPQTYVLLLACAEGDRSLQIQSDTSSAIIAYLQAPQASLKSPAILFDAIAAHQFLPFPLEAIAQQQTYRAPMGELVSTQSASHPLADHWQSLEPSLARGEQSNSSIIYGNGYILKLFRQVEEGVNPDLEMGRFLSEQQQITHTPAIVGWLEYRRRDATGATAPPSITLGILQELVPEARSSWDYTLDHLRDFFELVGSQYNTITDVPIPEGTLLDVQATFDVPEMKEQDGLQRLERGETSTLLVSSSSGAIASFPTSESLSSSSLAIRIMGPYLSSMRLLGQRTAELHLALAANTSDPNFAPEPFTSFYQRSIYQYSRNLTGKVFLLLKNRLSTLPPETRTLAQQVLNRQDEFYGRFGRVLEQKITTVRLRCHGDYHLGQVLYTGKDFVIIDFEGEPARTLSERRMKRSPLRDVAGMLQSFNYAATIALRSERESGMIQASQISMMEQWIQFWYTWVSAAFLNSYLRTAATGTFLPSTPLELQILLEAYLLEKVIYELGYELNNRPSWVDIPLQRLLQL